MKYALISVSRKEGIFPLAEALIKHGIQILASDGTMMALQARGIPATAISDYTDSKPILQGRVKTLHVDLFAGILADKSNPQHQLDLKERNIQAIEFVIVDLYPFLEHRHDKNSAIENIDVGGVSLIRAAAKNYQSCSIICDEEHYAAFIEELDLYQGSTTLSFRERMAMYAFHKTSVYDQHIAAWFKEKSLNAQKTILLKESLPLRYGENPHQQAGFYLPVMSKPMFTLLQGPALSYNNLLDLEAGIKLVLDMSLKAATVIKHTNPCGVAQGERAHEVAANAFSADLKSAFGGVMVLNTNVDEHTAHVISSRFLELLAAPSFTLEALRILEKKTGLRVIQYTPFLPTQEIKSLLNGILIQDRDDVCVSLGQCTVPTKLKPGVDEWPIFCFAMSIVKHLKSNAIAIVKKDKSLGLSGGQTNRVDAIAAAIERAQAHNLTSAILASDGFLPFADNIELIAKSGIRHIIQPGGSKRDYEIIQLCDEYGLCMIMTGLRQFKH